MVELTSSERLAFENCKAALRLCLEILLLCGKLVRVNEETAPAVSDEEASALLSDFQQVHDLLVSLSEIHDNNQIADAINAQLALTERLQKIDVIALTSRFPQISSVIGEACGCVVRAQARVNEALMR